MSNRVENDDESSVTIDGDIATGSAPVLAAGSNSEPDRQATQTMTRVSKWYEPDTTMTLVSPHIEMVWTVYLDEVNYAVFNG